MGCWKNRENLSGWFHQISRKTVVSLLTTVLRHLQNGKKTPLIPRLLWPSDQTSWQRCDCSSGSRSPLLSLTFTSIQVLNNVTYFKDPGTLGFWGGHKCLRRSRSDNWLGCRQLRGAVRKFLCLGHTLGCVRCAPEASRHRDDQHPSPQ